MAKRDKEENRQMKLEELAELSGVPARTIRLYISRGLVDGPLRVGRGAVYGERHLERLKMIRQMKAEGLTLREIAIELGGDKEKEILPQPSAWWSYRISEDVVVSVRADIGPWRGRQIKKALKSFADGLRSVKKEEK